MGKTLKYVSEFQFPSHCGYSGSAGKTMVKGYSRGGYNEGGSCKPMAKAEGGRIERARNAVSNERQELNRVEAKQRDAGQEISRVRSEMRYDKNELRGARKQYPVNRGEPMIPMARPGPQVMAPVRPAMAKGGMTGKQQAKMGKVMGEYKSGELHSGSKSGPLVKNRKQAIAIAMSEARNAGKK